MSKVIPPVKPYFPTEDVERIKRDVEVILKSGMLTMGKFTTEFEKLFAESCKVRNAVATNSGTSALEIALRAMGLKSGDNVLVPTNTFTATAAIVFYAGGKPILTDVNPDSLCIDAENIRNRMTKKVKGVIVVHVAGLVCPDIDEIRELCEEEDLFLVEDAAHAHGSSYKGAPAGSLGDVGCFSFYPTKVMTSGEGGMITTNDDETAEKARILRDQGKESFHSSRIVELGHNWRLPEISAAVGITQLKRLGEIVRKRNKIASYYNERLGSLEKIAPRMKPQGIVDNYYKYVAFVGQGVDRDEVKKRLREKGVMCGGEVYWPPLHLQPIYQRLLGTAEGDFPDAEKACKRMLCLPMYTQMPSEDAEYVVDTVSQTLPEI